MITDSSDDSLDKHQAPVKKTKQKKHKHGNINKTGVCKAVLAEKVKTIYRIKRKVVTVESR